MDTIRFVFGAFLICIFAACTKEMSVQDVTEESILRIGLAGTEQVRSVTAYSDVKDYEMQTNDLQVYVYDGDGNRIAFRSRETGFHATHFSGIVGSMFVYSLSWQCAVNPGNVTVVGIANAPDLFASSATLSSIRSVTLDFGSTVSTDVTKGFVMYGEWTASVRGGETVSVSLPLRRRCARIAVGKIQNALPSHTGQMRIESVYLSDYVSGCQRLSDGVVPVPEYSNRQGRRDGTLTALTNHECETTVLNGETLDLSSFPLCFYCLPNRSPNVPAGWTDEYPSDGRKTSVVFLVRIGGNSYYYPVVLNGVEAGSCYTVGLTVAGLGLNDPADSPEMIDITSSITLSGFLPGDTFDKRL